MFETLAEYAERARPSRTRGWMHAIADDYPDPTFSPEFIAGLTPNAIGATIHLTTEQIDEIKPSTELDPVAAGPAVINECIFDYQDGDDGVLLYVEIVDGTLTDDGADFIVAAIHHPRDVYAAAGTPLRHVMDVLQGGFDVCAIADARQALLRDTGVEEGAEWLYSAPPCRGREFWDTCPNEFWDTYCGGIEAANRALHAAGRNRDFPQPSMSTHGNDEYIALAARDLIGTAAGWTQDAYERVARPYAQATGRKLHPEDDLHTGSSIGTVRPREERLAMLAELGVTELADRVDHFMTVALVLGDHLADIAELVGLDRDVEDLSITPRVRELVSDPRVRRVLDEFTETRRRAHHDR